MRNVKGKYDVRLVIRKVINCLRGRRSTVENPEPAPVKITAKLWYPSAHVVTPWLPTQGDYPMGYPRGAVVHYTAGGMSLSELDLARQLEYTYFLISHDGGVYQGFPLNRWGSHAGKSSWPGLGKGVSKHLVGIEVDCAGKLTWVHANTQDGGFYTHWGAKKKPEEVRVIDTDKENIKAGAYHAFTEAQERALEDLLVWLKTNNPYVFDLDLVLGHDEVSPGRKIDPGGSLSMTMPDFRKRLRDLYRSRLGEKLET